MRFDLGKISLEYDDDFQFFLFYATKYAVLGLHLNNTLEKASPFSKIWIWENNTTVLDQWNYKEHTFAIDISCNNLTGQGVSLALRQRCSAEQYKIICEQYFSSILVKHGWEYRNNWRYMKAYNEITNEDEKNYFIQEIHAFLNDLNLLAKQGE